MPDFGAWNIKYFVENNFSGFRFELTRTLPWNVLRFDLAIWVCNSNNLVKSSVQVYRYYICAKGMRNAMWSPSSAWKIRSFVVPNVRHIDIIVKLRSYVKVVNLSKVADVKFYHHIESTTSMFTTYATVWHKILYFNSSTLRLPIRDLLTQNFINFCHCCR